jgi:MFS family permease
MKRILLVIVGSVVGFFVAPLLLLPLAGGACNVGIAILGLFIGCPVGSTIFNHIIHKRKEGGRRIVHYFGIFMGILLGIIAAFSSVFVIDKVGLGFLFAFILAVVPFSCMYGYRLHKAFEKS